MLITTLPLRIALITALDGSITYQGQSIRVFEEYLMETTTKKKAILTGGVEAYVIILNQTSQEARSNKCNRNNNDSVQIQINTVYPAGKGGSKVAEEISQVILNLLFPSSIKIATLTMPNGLALLKAELLSQRNINYDGSASRTWVTQLVLETWISQ